MGMGPFNCPEGFSVGATQVFNSSGQFLGTGGTADYLSALLTSEVSVTTTTAATIGRLHVCSGTSADYNLTLPAASTWTGKFIGARMAHGLTKLVSIVPNGTEKIHSRFGQQSSFVMWADESATFYSDGSNVFVINAQMRPMQARLSLTTAQTFSAGVTTLLNFTTLSYSSCPAAFVTASSASFTIKRAVPIKVELVALTNNSNTTANGLDLHIYKNGADYAVGATYSPASFFTTVSCCPMIDVLAVGDVLTPLGAYTVGSYTTQVFYPDAKYNQFSITELV